jgi:hypothetical protein
MIARSIPNEGNVIKNFDFEVDVVFSCFFARQMMET